MGAETLVDHVMCLEMLITVAFQRSCEPFSLVEANGCVGTILVYIWSLPTL